MTMAAADAPPPAYPGIDCPQFVSTANDIEFVITRFRFSAGMLGGTSSVKIFAEDFILDDLTPVLFKMFPRGNLRRDRNEHMLRVELGYTAVEYWQMQIFKLVSSRGFKMRTSHSSAFNAEKITAVTYTFAR